jgi:hypothetical protein
LIDGRINPDIDVFGEAINYFETLGYGRTALELER